MADAFQFLIATVIWSLVGADVLKTGQVHPIALFAIWLIGFVWMAGYIGSGVRVADHLTRVWLWTMVAIVAVGIVIAAILS